MSLPAVDIDHTASIASSSRLLKVVSVEVTFVTEDFNFYKAVIKEKLFAAMLAKILAKILSA